MFILVLVCLTQGLWGKSCEYSYRTLKNTDFVGDCSNLSISNCKIQCDPLDESGGITEQQLTEFVILNTLFVDCDDVRMVTKNGFGSITNVTFTASAQHSTTAIGDGPPVIVYLEAARLQISMLFDNASDHTCILISPTIELKDNVTCPNLVLHQQEGDFTLAHVTATHTQCTTVDFNPLVGFVNVTPHIDGKTYSTKANLSVEYVLNLLDAGSAMEMHYKLVSPLSGQQNYTLLILVENGQLIIPANTSVFSAKLGLFARSMQIDGLVRAPMGCEQNMGPGRGVSFYYTGARCAGSGGSSAGQGGTGLAVQGTPDLDEQCYLLAEAVKFMARLHPYNGLGFAGSGSGGGLQLGADTQQLPQLGRGYGGGYIKLESEGLVRLNGKLMTDGDSGSSSEEKDSGPIYNGAGGGGSILISAGRVVGNGNITARGGDSDETGYSGEGGGGLIQVILFDLENVQHSIESQGFTGRLDVSKGTRKMVENKSLYLGTEGTVLLPGCLEGQEMVQLTCQVCPEGEYSFMLAGQCSECPGVPLNRIGSNKEQQCLHDDCIQFKCDPLKFITTFITSGWGVLAYINLFIVIVAGYIVRRMYRLKEAHVEQLPFDFESATKHMIITHIITETLRKNVEFQLVDLMYHAHRIVLQGSNTYSYPWQLPTVPSEEIQYIVDQEEWAKFTGRLNKLAEWHLWEIVLIMIFAVLYYPFYWALVRYLKKRKFKRIKQFVHTSDVKLWKFLNAEEQVFIKLKMSKSADYTLFYLDIFNYKNSDLKYFFLACPYIIMLSGEGSYLRPYYLCESDPFLSCLYFAINKSCDHDQDDERYRIMENLVAHKKRMENSSRMNKFLTKFNRYARTIDFGSSAGQFCSQVRDLLTLLKLWNEKFFEKRSIRLDLVVMQTPLDGIGNQTITVLENPQSVKFDTFMSEIHQRYTLKQILDVKFGMFIYDTEMDIQEIDDALNNQKISFFEQPRVNSFLNIEIEEDEDISINDLKEQYINRTNTNQQNNTQSLVARQKSQAFPHKHHKHRRQPIFQRIVYLVDYLRYQIFSHRITTYNKYTIILLELVLTFIDAIFLPLFLIGNIQDLMQPTWTFVDIQFMLIPFPFAFYIAPIIGCLWMSTQSYGIAKLHLIFNFMSACNLALSVFLRCFMVGGPQSKIAILIMVFDLVVKCGIIFCGKFILSINVKLNKLNQAKHIAGQ